MVTCCWCPGSYHDFSSLDLSSESLLLMTWPLPWLQQPRSQMRQRYFKAMMQITQIFLVWLHAADALAPVMTSAAWISHLNRCCWCPGPFLDFSSRDLRWGSVTSKPWCKLLRSSLHGYRLLMPWLLSWLQQPGSLILIVAADALAPSLTSAAAISDGAALLQRHGANYSDPPCIVTGCWCPGSCHDFSSLDLPSESLLLMPWPLPWLQQPRSQMKLRYFKAMV